jgi:2,3-bisphosphoglycerate-independent phosphoglycerate mutase
MHILMLFFDGWGLGTDDPAINPFLNAPMPTLRHLYGTMPTGNNGRHSSAHASLVPTDATLGVAGLPQSGTGQTSLFTGINAPRSIGAHSGPYPNDQLREILANGNIFIQLLSANCNVTFANAYPPFFFDRLARGKARRSATSFAAGAAGLRYRDIDDLRQGTAVSGFVTNARWHEFDPTVPLIAAHEAGKNLARLAHAHDFTLFEYFLTDAAGHRGEPDWTAQVLGEVDELLRGALEETDLADTLIVVTSDHGNVEDVSAKGHTLNPVPTMLVGAGREQIARRIHSLTDITPAIVQALQSE